MRSKISQIFKDFDPSFGEEKFGEIGETRARI